MVSLDEITTLPREIRGKAWILLQKRPNVTLGELRKLATSTTIREDRDLRLTPATMVNVARPAEHLAKPPTIDSGDMELQVDPMITAILGTTLAWLLADGHSQSEAGRIMGIAQSGVAKRIVKLREIFPNRV